MKASDIHSWYAELFLSSNALTTQQYKQKQRTATQTKAKKEAKYKVLRSRDWSY